MKRFLFSFVLFLVALFGFSFAQETTFDPMAMPAITQYVEDFSKVLTPAELADLRSIAYRHSAQTTNQIVTVLFPNREGNNLLDIGVKVFNENGIGQKQADNGLLLLIATEEEKIRIVVGYGMEGIITDSASKKIVEAIRPSINEKAYYSGIKLFYDLVLEKIKTAEIEGTGQVVGGISVTDISKNIGWWILMTLAGIIGGFVFPFKKKRKLTQKIKSYFGGPKNLLWRQIVGIGGSYILLVFMILPVVYPAFTWMPFYTDYLLQAFVPSFLVGFLFALIPPGTFKKRPGGQGFGGFTAGDISSSSSSSSSSDSSSSSSDSGGFDSGGGDTGGGGGGDD